MTSRMKRAISTIIKQYSDLIRYGATVRAPGIVKS